MRSLLLLAALTACAPLDDTDPIADEGALPIDVSGVWGPDGPDTAAIRVVQLRPDLSTAVFAFNDTGIPFGSRDGTALPFPAMTPLLPRPVDDVSLQLLEGPQRTVVHDSELGSFVSPFAEVVSWGIAGDERTLHLDIDPSPEPGRVNLRLINACVGLQYAGFAPISQPPGTPLVSAFEGDVSPVVSIPADAVQRWALDINGDGRWDVPYESFSLSATDGAGNGQYVEIFLAPSGATVPGTPIPVPILLVVPLTGPAEAFAVLPATG